MLNKNDFSKKQLVFVFAKDGEKIAFANENLIVKIEKNDDKTDSKIVEIKFQVSLYKLFLVYIIGDLSITTVIIKNARKYGFYIALMSNSFKLYDLIGAKKDANTLLHEKQYMYKDISIAKLIVKNKLLNQRNTLNNIRQKDCDVKKAIIYIDENIDKLNKAINIYELLSIEGNSAKIYFKNIFSSLPWIGRKPRIKIDFINCTLDIGYTILFALIDSIISCYGFDTYKGVYHTQFYMRKSLVCDLVEPFRCLIDWQVRKAYNLGQIDKNDFLCINHQYKLKWEKSKDYVSFLMNCLIDRKDDIFIYLQEYYRAFMKGKDIRDYPMFMV